MTESRDLASEIYIWKNQDISQYIIKQIKAKLKESQEELTDGNLIVSHELAREYCRAIGEIQGYRFVLELMESGEKSE